MCYGSDSLCLYGHGDLALDVSRSGSSGYLAMANFDTLSHCAVVC